MGIAPMIGLSDNPTMNTQARVELGPDFGLGEDLDALRQAVVRFAAERIAPIATAVDRDNRFPRSLWPELGAQGLLGITVHERWGGSDLGYLAQVIAMEEISRASGAIGLSYGAHSNLCINQIRLNGTDAQKDRYLPRLVSGEHVGALAMSETGAGSDVVSMRLAARADGDHFVLDGTKMWITNGPIADVLVIYAKTTPEAGSRGISAFLVERGTPGFEPQAGLDKLGMRGSPTGELVFRNCRIPAANLLGELNRGVAVLMSGLDYERLVLAGGPLGLLSAALDLVLPYARERRQFGQAIGEFQLIQAKLAKIYADLAAGRALVYSLARAADLGQVQRRDAAAAIWFTADRATQAALEAVQILGGNGYMSENLAGRLLRDAKLYEIGAGTQEIRLMLMGRELMAAG
jgi:isovaleryl-CoA dehydrogenase